MKEIKLRPKTDDHDLDVKLRAARRFIEAGNKVKFTVRFRGREITHPERANMQLDLIWSRLEDLANMEQRPTMEAKTMALILAPKPQIMQRLAQLRAQRDKDRENKSGPDNALPSGTDHELDDYDDEPEEQAELEH